MNAKERLLEYLKYKGIGQTKFEEVVGISRGYINNNKGSLGSSTLAKISACPDCSDLDIGWLTTGDGEMLRHPEITTEVTAVPEETYMMAEFAVLNGNGGRLGGGDVANLPETQTRLIPREYEKGNYLVVKITGNSMNDGTDRSISDGDDVLIRELEPDEWDDLPIRTRLFVITSREGNVIKQITEVNKDEGYIMCHSFNQSYVDFKIQFSDIYQIFVVYKIVQKQITL